VSGGGPARDATARAGAPARAVVWVGGEATAYLRAGCGAVVVLLMADYDGPAALELIALLSMAHLVIAPSVPRDVALPGWLASLLEGLGLASVCVVAERAFIDDVRMLARDDASLVSEVGELKVPWSALELRS
jgi:hypothetical protein